MVETSLLPSSPLRAHLAVVAAAVLFGTTFVTVQAAVEDAEPVPFLAVRFLIGAAALAPFALRSRPAVGAEPGLLKAGVLCGLALLAGYVFQTVGLQYTSSTVSAFITYLLVILVPLIGAVAGRRLPTAGVTAGVVLSVAGLALLTGGASGAGFGRGELLTLGCAFAFAFHIVMLGELAPRYDTLRLNAVQLATVGALCLVPGAFLGGYRFPPTAWAAAAFTALAATALAFALQVYGQTRVGPTRTALLLMIEPVSAAALGWLSGDRLRWAAVVGAALILGGIALAELPVFARRGAP
ncbi:MAG: DMT family transporter [Acidimicrobiia bacterium]